MHIQNPEQKVMLDLSLSRLIGIPSSLPLPLLGDIMAQFAVFFIVEDYTHYWIHRQSQSNFASVFAYCDYIYGTDKGYRFQKKLLRQLKEGFEINGQENEGLQINGQDLKSD
ncbi:hypothetical protein LguiA_034197 [Lonicera macranthoides]